MRGKMFDDIWSRANRGKRSGDHERHTRDALSNHPKPNGFIFLVRFSLFFFSPIIIKRLASFKSSLLPKSYLQRTQMAPRTFSERKNPEHRIPESGFA